MVTSESIPLAASPRKSERNFLKVFCDTYAMGLTCHALRSMLRRNRVDVRLWPLSQGGFPMPSSLLAVDDQQSHALGPCGTSIWGSPLAGSTTAGRTSGTMFSSAIRIRDDVICTFLISLLISRARAVLGEEAYPAGESP